MRKGARFLLTGAIVACAVLGFAGAAQATPDKLVSGQTCLGTNCHAYDPDAPHVPAMRRDWKLLSVPGQDPASYEISVTAGSEWAVLATDPPHTLVGSGSRTGTITLSPYGHYTMWVGALVGGLPHANYVDLPFLLRPTAITISRSTSSVRGLRSFELSGVLSPGSLGDSCVVDVRKPKSSRWSYSSARSGYAVTSGGGVDWWYRYGPKVKGTYSFRVRFVGDTIRAASTSGVVSVAVR